MEMDRMINLPIDEQKIRNFFKIRPTQIDDLIK